MRERLTVTTDRDDDRDGRPDVISFDVVRPATSQRVPVIVNESPYYGGSGRGPLGQDKKRDSSGVVVSMPLFYDNFFVPRGYAYVAIDAPGTGLSTGCGDDFGPRLVASARQVIAFLAGRSTAMDTHGRSVRATWSTGAVGMIGKSADGTYPLGVAATGDSALRTIVSIAGIDDLFTTRSILGQGSPFELAGVGTANGSIHPRSGCEVSDRTLTAAANAAGSNPNARYWTQRRQLPVKGQWTAATLLVSGQRDDTVPADQTARLWSALGEAGVGRMWWISRGGHDDPFDLDRAAWVDTLHRWFDHYLLGLNTGIEGQPPVRVQQSDLSWRSQAGFPLAGSIPQPWTIGATLEPGPAAPATNQPLAIVSAFASQTGVLEGDPFYQHLDRKVANRFAVESAPLSSRLDLSGSASITIRLRTTDTAVPVVVEVVDVGTAPRPTPEAPGSNEFSQRRPGVDCWGSSTAHDSACYPEQALVLGATSQGLLARAGTADLTASSQWKTVQLTTTPMQLVIPVGHRLGVIVATNDPVTVPPRAGALAIGDGGSISLPIVTG